MNIPHIFFVTVVSTGLGLSGCAKDKETMVETTTTDRTTKRVHTQEELRKTGETQTGPALEKVDPSIQTSGRP